MKNFKLIGAFVIALIALFTISAMGSEAGFAAASFGWVGAHLNWKKEVVLNKLRKDHPNAIIADSYLRVEQELVSAQSVYNFNLQKTGADIAVERKLLDNDIFVMTELGIFIYESTTAEIGREVFATYANASAFANVTAANVQDLETVYNGELEIRVGNTVYSPNWDTKRHRFVPSSQKGTTSAAITGPVVYTIAETEDNEWAGFAPLTEALKLSGQGTNEINLKINLFNGAVLTHNSASHKNKVVLYPRGFVIKNAATRK